jgi:hypothetical protein
MDAVAIAIVVFGIYFPRHHRRDMVVALLIANLGVLSAVTALRSSSTADTLGLGLFGILSIIRLRSSQVEQQEVAYYFAALALGVLSGLRVHPVGLAPALVLAMLVALYVGDHPSLFPGHRRHILTLDRAFTDETALVAHLTELLGARIRHVRVEKLDLVHDTTVVEVRYQLPKRAGLEVGR